jgi:hypothetical protein
VESWAAMVDPKTPLDEPPHDVLAAEAFAVPAPDPGLLEAQARDVLAAEAFAVPAPDPVLHHGPVVLPGDLTGAAEPRDVLAAEEFAMPAAPLQSSGVVLHELRPSWQRTAVAGVGFVVALRLLLRALRRR